MTDPRNRGIYQPRFSDETIEQVKADYAAGLRRKQLLKKYNINSIHTLDNWLYGRTRNGNRAPKIKN